MQDLTYPFIGHLLFVAINVMVIFMFIWGPPLSFWSNLETIYREKKGRRENENGAKVREWVKQ